jgi:hypothetical protein
MRESHDGELCISIIPFQIRCITLFMPMGWGYVSELQPPTGLFCPSDDIQTSRATAEWYWQGKTEEVGENPVHVPSRIQHGLTRERTRASVVRGRQLTAIRRLKIVKMLTGNQSVLGAAKEISVLTGPSDSSGGCQSALVDKLGVRPKQYHPWST